MSLNDLQDPNLLQDDSEEDEEMYVAIPFRFHDLAERDNYEALAEEIRKYNKKDYNPNDVQLSLDQEDNLGFTPLHIAIMRGNLNTIRVCIENNVNLTLNTEGIPYSIFLLTVAASKNIFSDNLFEVLKMLVIPGKMETMKDRLGRTIAHVAASFNMVSVLESILQEYPSLLEMLDNDGNSILFSACYANAVDVVSFLMDSYPQLAALQNKYNQSVLHICLISNAIEAYQTLIRSHNENLDIRAEDAFGNVPIDIWKKIMEAKRDSTFDGFPHEESKTLIIIPEPYDDHKTCDDPPKRTEKVLPPEQIQRLRVMLDASIGGCLLQPSLGNRVELLRQSEPLDLADILRVHDINYVMKLIRACNSETATGLSRIDVDTVVSEKSFIQAKIAAKSACLAVDELVRNPARRHVFCCVRPPGHHIGTNGPIHNDHNNNVSQGFCLLNNVAIAAAYARAKYPQLNRIAIVDLDVHHGNGTEDCVQHLAPCEKRFDMVSENVAIQYKKYCYKPWRDQTDPENVLFASIHGFGKIANNLDYFYPGSGNAPNKVDFVPNKQMGVDFKRSEIIDCPISRDQAAISYFWRENLRTNIFPRILEFKPDLIFISAGFDAHQNDLLNNGFGGLTEFDFAYATRELVKLSNRVCNGRVISILEGGYNVRCGCCSPLAGSVFAHVGSLDNCFYFEAAEREWEVSSAMEREEAGERLRLAGKKLGLEVRKVSEEEEEEEFDFDDCSEEEKESNIPEAPKAATPGDVKNETPDETPDETPMEEDESEDLADYEMPELEAGECDKIVDPLAEQEESGRKRSRPKVDYVALEAQLRKEEEEMRKKMMKKNE